MVDADLLNREAGRKEGFRHGVRIALVIAVVLLIIFWVTLSTTIDNMDYSCGELLDGVKPVYILEKECPICEYCQCEERYDS